MVDPNASDGFRPGDGGQAEPGWIAALAFPETIRKFPPLRRTRLEPSTSSAARHHWSARTMTGRRCRFSTGSTSVASQAGVLGMAGVQMQFERLAIFAQASVVRAQSSFLLGNNALGFFEGGVRYNFGSFAARCFRINAGRGECATQTGCRARSSGAASRPPARCRCAA